MRKEKDALGGILVPEEKYFDAQTQRAVQNFDIGREYFPREFIRAHEDAGCCTHEDRQ